MKILLISFLSLIVISCSTTSPNNVSKSDAQKVTKIEYGTIKTSLPVKIKGESDWIGGVAGAMIGGLIGAQICGDKEIIGTKCQDIGIVYGTVGGAALGSVVQAKLGTHNGYQYIITIDGDYKDTAFVQGDKEPLLNGQKVIIIYGDTIRIMPYYG